METSMRRVPQMVSLRICSCSRKVLRSRAVRWMTSRAVSPAGVRVTPCLLRRKSAAPRSASMFWSRLLRVGWER